MIEDDAVAALAALAHGDRLKAFRLLVKAGPDGMPSGEVAGLGLGGVAVALAIQPTRMSFHLAALERSGLVSARRVGRKIYYAVRFDDMRRLLAFLTEDCCNGHPEICSGLPSPNDAAAKEDVT